MWHIVFIAPALPSVSDRTVDSFKVTFTKVDGDDGTNMDYKVFTHKTGEQAVGKVCPLSAVPCLIESLSSGTEYTVYVVACPKATSHTCSKNSPEAKAWTMPQGELGKIIIHATSINDTARSYSSHMLIL